MYNDYELKVLKRKIWLQNLLIIVSILLFSFLIINAIGIVIGNLFYKEFFLWNTRLDHRRFQPLRVQLEEGIKNKHWQNINLDSRLGYSLRGTYIPNPKTSPNTVVFVHGIAGSRLMGLWYAPIYLSAGYNVLIYDSRACGESGGPSISWGYYEKYDLDQWIDWLEQLHPTGIVGVHGVSMGGATALMHAEINERSHRVKFYIADSSYTDLEDLLTQQINTIAKLNHPLAVKILLRYSNIAASWQSGFGYQDVSPIRSLKTVTTPILFLHGDADLLVPVYMSEQLYAAAKGYKEKYIFSGDAHAMSVFHHKAEYRKGILKFIDTALQQ